MLFKYKLKNKWYSVDIPKDEYDTFLDLTFADKMKYIKLLKQQEKAEKGADEVSQDLGFSVLGTKKATPAPNQTVEQLQEKENKKILAKKKMAELTKIENEITNKVKDIESKPDAEANEKLINELEKLLEQKEILVREIQTLNVENVAVMNVKSVDTLNIKGINKLVSDMNSSNITETFKQVKDELDKVYKQFGDEELSDKLHEATKEFLNDFNKARNNELNESEARLYAILKMLCDKIKYRRSYNGQMFNFIFKYFSKPVPAFDDNKNVICVFEDMGRGNQEQLALCVNLLLAYNQNYKEELPVINLIRWGYDKDKNLESVKTVVGTVFTLPIDKQKPRFYKSLIEMVEKLSRYGKDEDRTVAKNKLVEFRTIIEGILNLEDEFTQGKLSILINGNDETFADTYSQLIKKLKGVKEKIDEKISKIDGERDRTRFKGSTDSDNEGEGLKPNRLTDMMLKTLEEKLKKTNESLTKIENKINELKGESKNSEPEVKETVDGVEDTNVFKIPKLNHVEPVIKPQFDEDTAFKDLKDILERRRKDIEYSEDDFEDTSFEWDDSYTELTAGSLKDASELIDSLRDNYNIVLRMYINKRKTK